MSAEESIRSYSDVTLQGAAKQLARHPRCGWTDSWEAQRLELLGQEIRRRQMAYKKEMEQ